MRWHFNRLPGAVELTLYTGSMYYAVAFAWRGRYWNGRRWWFGRAVCLCCWYGPDMYDGCSDCIARASEVRCAQLRHGPELDHCVLEEGHDGRHVY